MLEHLPVCDEKSSGYPSTSRLSRNLAVKNAGSEFPKARLESGEPEEKSALTFLT